MKRIEKILFAVAFALLVLIILAAGAFSYLVSNTRQTADAVYIADVVPLTVETNSMWPEFGEGDLIFVRRIEPQTLREGDVVCFRTVQEGRYVLSTHRIVSIAQWEGGRSYTTRGDNTPLPDSSIHADAEIVGLYIGERLPGAGALLNRIAGGFGLISLILLPLVLFLGMLVFNTASRLRAMRQGGPAPNDTAAATLALARATMQEVSDIRAEADEAWAQLVTEVRSKEQEEEV